MINIKEIIKKRFYIFLLSFSLLVSILIGYCNTKLMPMVIKYGSYECNDIMNRLINEVVSDNITEQIKNEILIITSGESTSLEFNTAALNSICATAIK